MLHSTTAYHMSWNIYIYLFIYIYLSIYTETHLSAAHTSVSTSGSAPLSDLCLGVTLQLNVLWLFLIRQYKPASFIYIPVR